MAGARNGGEASGTLELAEVHVLTLQILQGASGTLKPLVIGRQLGQDTFEQQRVMVERAVLTILGVATFARSTVFF